MRGRVVDDVRGSCYYQTVPRVKSGLPVYGSPVGCATCVARQAPGNSWLSFEEIRTRLEVGPGTPSLKRPAKTFAPGSHARLCRWKQTKRSASEPWSEIRSEVRRGVTVVGDLV